MHQRASVRFAHRCSPAAKLAPGVVAVATSPNLSSSTCLPSIRLPYLRRGLSDRAACSIDADKERERHRTEPSSPIPAGRLPQISLLHLHLRPSSSSSPSFSLLQNKTKLRRARARAHPTSRGTAPPSVLHVFPASAIYIQLRHLLSSSSPFHPRALQPASLPNQVHLRPPNPPRLSSSSPTYGTHPQRRR